MVTKKKIAYATMWSTSTIVLITLLRLGSSVVSSRVLLPEDFGVLAFALAMGALLNQLSFFGVESALVQRKEVDFEDLDVAWTFEFMRKGALALLLLLCTPLLMLWMDDHRISWVVPMCCLSMVVTSFRNNGMVMFRRNFQFRQIFLMDVLPVLLQAIFVVVGVLLWPNIMVLLIGALVHASTLVFMSYLLFGHRPRVRWHWERLKGLLSFGGCLLGNTIVQMIRNQGVTFALGGFAGTTVLGFFNRGRVFSSNIFIQANGLVWRVAYPLFSNRYHSPDGIRDGFRSLMALLLFIAPMLLVLYAVIAPDFIPWILTSKWSPSVPFMQLFCIESLLVFLLAPAEIAFQSIGRPVLGTARQVVACVLFLALIYPMVLHFGVKGVVVASIVSTLIILPAYVAEVRRSAVKFSWGSAVRWVLPSCFSIIALWQAYLFVSSLMHIDMLKWMVGGLAALVAYGLAYVVFLRLFSSVQIAVLIEVLPVRLQSKARKYAGRLLLLKV